MTLVTLFGRSNFTYEGGFQADWQAVTALRRREDEAFARSLNLPLHYFELPEASLRDIPILARGKMPRSPSRRI